MVVVAVDLQSRVCDADAAINVKRAGRVDVVALGDHRTRNGQAACAVKAQPSIIRLIQIHAARGYRGAVGHNDVAALDSAYRKVAPEQQPKVRSLAGDCQAAGNLNRLARAALGVRNCFPRAGDNRGAAADRVVGSRNPVIRLTGGDVVPVVWIIEAGAAQEGVSCYGRRSQSAANSPDARTFRLQHSQNLTPSTRSIRTATAGDWTKERAALGERGHNAATRCASARRQPPPRADVAARSAPWRAPRARLSSRSPTDQRAPASLKRDPYQELLEGDENPSSVATTITRPALGSRIYQKLLPWTGVCQIGLQSGGVDTRPDMSAFSALRTAGADVLRT